MPENGSDPDGRADGQTDDSSDEAYRSFETADDELIIYDPQNHKAFVVSDSWTSVSK